MVKVLLYSGGMDSFCLNYLEKPDILLYINLGTEDGKKEIENLQKLPFKNKIKIVNLNSLSDFELENKIIPFRNTFLILIAAQFGNEIYLGATKGDTTKDKDYVFKSQMESHLNYFALDKNKVNVKDYPYIIHLPFKELTKTQIIRKYLENGGSVEDLLKYSRSCYNGKEKECGICRSCIRKATALVLNNINIENIFENNPFSKIDEKMLERDGESEDYKKVLRKIGKINE
ncbi:MAG: 7-cyano-7-deazaguanine synthase [Candidatus Aenigmatarchaeota archaeon]